MKPKADEIAAMFRSVSLGAPQNAVGFVMWRVVHRYQREADQALREIGLTHLQFVTLALVAWIGREGAPANQAEIARAGDIHPMQVSNVLAALEEKSLVERAPSEAHARRLIVTLTARGLAALRAAMPLMIEVQARLFGSDGQPGGVLLRTLQQIDQPPKTENPRQ